MSGQSNVGNSGVYEAGDQRNQAENQRTPYEEGQSNSHQDNDSKDQRSIANRLAQASPQNDDTSGKDKSDETKAGEIDPTLPAKMHGNEPSRGAKVDKNIADEEAEIIRKMDEKKAQK
ncbi:uncharacterized protein A1O9_08136 [Exophiala aquamarina CBS 119918]|uniref:Uncharacterized protein n=1 Tax=Exophiala aquamarina CBS 119918 TaxID=1182545 RepID=A0A072P6A9_9EURO|nr:uncharacterized protein A1O9_08136 [Exophiala aquamarina CBS 119918]KEF55386.1 hypothetical protein A1O9_08136 [Exophiala aquamarina CBS 119918]